MARISTRRSIFSTKTVSSDLMNSVKDALISLAWDYKTTLDRKFATLLRDCSYSARARALSSRLPVAVTRAPSWCPKARLRPTALQIRQQTLLTKVIPKVVKAFSHTRQGLAGNLPTGLAIFPHSRQNRTKSSTRIWTRWTIFSHNLDYPTAQRLSRCPRQTWVTDSSPEGSSILIQP